MQYLRENEKWDEIPYLDLFYYLGQKTEWQKECGIMALKVEDSQYECSGCKTWEVCMKCAAKSSRREEDLSLAIAPSAPPLSRERLGQEREEVESDTDEEEDEREVTDFDDSPGSQGNIQTPAASNSQARSPNEQRTPIAVRTRHERRNNEGPHMIAPLREAMGPQGGRVLIKVPFSPGDLVIWKQSAGSYREDPERVARVVKMVIKTQNPDWNDLQVLLDTIMDSTEKEMVLRATKERAREEIKLRRNREQGYEGTVDELVPSDDPEWNPNSADGYRAIRKYQELLVEGVRTGMPKTLNWSKLYSVRQEKNESPSAFLERLKETARRYTNLEIDEEPGQLQLALLFMGQSQEDIRKKLQKLEGDDTRKVDKMLEVAWKVYNNREKETAKRQQAGILAIIQQTTGRGGGQQGRGHGRGRGRGFGFGRGGFQGQGLMGMNNGRQTGLGPNQCAFCRQLGHWKNECPVRNGIGSSAGVMGEFPMAPVDGAQAQAQAMMLGNYRSQS
ncbi:hypothetical protein DV515_00018048 [Chloebia gouldiae]|uniref:Core shell protein Gag P30 domain-containing protein n=1 Tax=Chloebia gouldiae TaxID=44316 RepID=A0A3L8Q8V2_CHLGU|nr:hypothetical protein DV515_00018048 [Chloebia gouldiae]